MNAKQMLLAVSILTCGLLVGCSEPCVPTEIIRVKLQETIYRLPASFQPYIHLDKKEFPTKSRIQNGLRVREYCQKTEDPPTTVDNFGFGQRSLNQIASEKPEFSRLQGLDLVAVEVTHIKPFPTTANSSGSLISGDLFRRVEKNGTFELHSTRPLLFGNPIWAFCGRAPKQEPSNWCTIWGQITPGTRIVVKLVDATHPIDDWPRILEDVERLTRSFTSP